MVRTPNTRKIELLRRRLIFDFDVFDIAGTIIHIVVGKN